ncbi:hypothetical protein AAFC00_005041 [Neodothiora populina]
MPIIGGKITGPDIRGNIMPSGGADWATSLAGSDFARLDARYSIRTDDNHYISIRSAGTFALPTSPSSSSTPPTDMPTTITQDHIEWFTNITIEAPGASPYNHLNSATAVGCLSQTDSVIFIDVYRLTNFPNSPLRDIFASGAFNKL